MRILFYYIHNSCPPLSGAHQRCLQLLRSLTQAGHEVIFVGSTLHTEQAWNEASKKSIREITGQPIYIFAPKSPLSGVRIWAEKTFRRFVLRKNGFRDG